MFVDRHWAILEGRQAAVEAVVQGLPGQADPRPTRRRPAMSRA